jgi:hypothetical protein
MWSKKLPIAEYSVVKKPSAEIFLSAYLSDRTRGAVKKNWLVENTGIEPVTSWLQTRRSPS